MVKHRNSSISENAARILNSKQGEYLGDDVHGPVATINIMPHLNICKRASCLNATSATIFTTPADKDFYLVSAAIGLIKDATATSTSHTISVIIEGLAVILLDIPGITLTAQTGTLSNHWGERGIKLDRGTGITVTASTSTANVRVHGAIQGYTVETTK